MNLRKHTMLYFLWISLHNFEMDYKFDKKQIRVDGKTEDLKIISLDEYRIRNRL